MLGGTQLNTGTYSPDDIADNAGRFRKFYVRSEPPAALEHDSDSERHWVEIEYNLEGQVFKFADYVKLMPMEDFQDETPDSRTREEVYWPE